MAVTFLTNEDKNELLGNIDEVKDNVATLCNNLKPSSKNKFNPETSVTGYIASKTGIVQESTTYKTTDFIDVSTFVNKICVSPKLRKFLAYDETKQAISASYNDNGTSGNFITEVPEGAKYIRVSYYNANEQSLMIEDNTECSSYEPYGSPTAMSNEYNPINDVAREKIMKIISENSITPDMSIGNVLYGKKWVACGDSFTEGDFNNSLTNDYIFTEGLYEGKKKVYPYFIGRRNNMEIVNEAKCGTTITNVGTRTDAFSISRYQAIPEDADYITLKFGINDDEGHQNAVMGTIDDATNETFYGAWNVVMEYLITNHPYAKIGIIITNGTTGVIADATRNIAKKWGIPYLDEDAGEQVPLLFRTHRTEVCTLAKNLRQASFVVNDGSNGQSANLHPNEKAHEYESTIVEAWLRTL